MGAFGAGLNQGMAQMDQFMQQKQMRDMFQTMQQGQMGRMADPTFAMNPQQIQGPVAPMGGVSLKNKMMSSMRGAF